MFINVALTILILAWSFAILSYLFFVVQSAKVTKIALFTANVTAILGIIFLCIRFWFNLNSGEFISLLSKFSLVMLLIISGLLLALYFQKQKNLPKNNKGFFSKQLLFSSGNGR